MTLRVAVLGAGIVGVATALELLRDGRQVTLIEPGEPGSEQAASYGNGAWLSPSSVVPISMPGLWRKVPGMLRDPLGPLSIRPGYMPRLLPWLVRFVRAGSTVARVRRTARALRPLLADAPERHRALAEQAGVPELIERRGLLYIYPSRADFEAEALAWQLRREKRRRVDRARRGRAAPAGTGTRSPLPPRHPGAVRGERGRPRCAGRSPGRPRPFARRRARARLGHRVPNRRRPASCRPYQRGRRPGGSGGHLCGRQVS